ncbi:3-hydroxybutyryl-CoA dehydrogenase [Luteithermobacter gelatinilyticus]|uniref:3-hydroxybutyryl-CoA dehydrogenase n=1 Tax=Luteithermobacter gelatinilyticus TaxID=2582913 RepID=UPI0011073800|nr:3-hydroxybutyryl-CoA dehydrogenase [Luteithermobacter gelatinilyticus]
MTEKVDKVLVVGAGRMGRGIALTFAFAGLPVHLVDMKDRSEDEQNQLKKTAFREIRTDLDFMASVGLLESGFIDDVLNRITLLDRENARPSAAEATLIFEGVPEVMEAKKQAFQWIDEHANRNAVLASTTSTMMVDELADLVRHPQNFVNAHWLNPAHLMPLVEISKGSKTSGETIDRLITILEQIGKVPIVCSSSPGYIVPRIQALAMNEAARMVEEGVASAEDIDKAVKVGFGLRFAVLGLLEFIDWGGGDILYYASDYLSGKIDPARFSPPDIVVNNMHHRRNGLKDGIGFYDYRNQDLAAYRNRRMTDFVRLVRHMDLAPQYNSMQHMTQQN